MKLGAEWQALGQVAERARQQYNRTQTLSAQLRDLLSSISDGSHAGKNKNE